MRLRYRYIPISGFWASISINLRYRVLRYRSYNDEISLSSLLCSTVLIAVDYKSGTGCKSSNLLSINSSSFTRQFKPCPSVLPSPICLQNIVLSVTWSRQWEIILRKKTRMLVQNVSAGGGHECEFLWWLRAVNLRCDHAHAHPIPERECAPSVQRAP